MGDDTLGQSDTQEQGLDDQPVLSAIAIGDRIDLTATGAWTISHVNRLAEQVDRVVPRFDGRGAVQLNMRGVSHFDTYGAALIRRVLREGRDRNANVAITGLQPAFARLLEMVKRAEVAPASPPKPKRLRAVGLSQLANLGRAMESAAKESSGLLSLLGSVVTALGLIVRNPSTFRLTATVHQFDRVAWQAVPIILMITFLIGGIIAQQGFFHFRKFGADQYVVDMVGLLVVREIGVLLVAIMVAGRSGSSYTAELGSMKMREEIDALGTMGLDPVAVLIVPRILALVVALPILTLLGSVAALVGGGLVASVYGDMSPAIYIARLQEALSMTHFKVGIIKAPFMALGIGLIACAEGLKVLGSAESLGLKTTESVVKAIFLVIVLDGLFAIYFAAIGM